ncbi:PREDICTED: probable sulfite oxidase, mitochondrial isoform X2 [Papilio polytes]|uniref:probable sulfite oxidase, mitochondrial isoform X2 n=1 Tax=Papilio polytes TaxID=76194 RepID=UPI0006764783|nr:PREDICTED: probable sulfite oxidase, mitochondrial isoform X2 [Papilio polytes]
MSLRKLTLRSLRLSNKLSYLPALSNHYNYKKYKGFDEKYSNFNRNVGAAIFASVIVGSTSDVSKEKLNTNKQEQTEPSKIIEAGEKKPNLPTYRAEEISKHNTKNSFWVTYRHGVYDVTSFLPSHPGGEQIYNAAGLSIEPFWNVYGMHKTQEVFELLESYRIGNLHDDDIVDHSDDELWAMEPYRDPRLIVKTAKPFNAEIPPEYQIAHFDTPNELFYVRQHMPVPELEAATHRVRVAVQATGAVRELSLAQLRRLPAASLRAALMCAGNRRSEMDKVKPVKGISWAGGAISNAVWSGVYLRDVLLSCGVDPEDTEGKHVILTGADIDATGQNFSTSIPLHVALDARARVLLATHMNGAPLPHDHGRPLRVIVPGAPAVRSVKWLECITVSSEESDSHWHKKDYRAFNPSTTWESADFERAPPVYSLPVTSAICRPRHGDTVPVRDGHVHLEGYAYSGGGARVVRVDVSADGGRSWAEARLQQDAAPHGHHYAWTLWSARLPVAAHATQTELWVKATDGNFNTQPENFEHIWNIRGILANAYHRITVRLAH